MASKIKNIIIFTIVAALLILAYIFFIKKDTEEGNLISTTSSSVETSVATTNTADQNSLVAKELLSVLLGVKNIELNDSIFSNKAFLSLRDSTILLVSPGDEGRPNPFAPIGYENNFSTTTQTAPVMTTTENITTIIPETSAPTLTPTTPKASPTVPKTSTTTSKEVKTP